MGHLRDERPRARKPHRCYLCGESIPAGEVHVRRTQADGDGVGSFRMHGECEAESRSWGWWEWEGISPGDMPRPKKAEVT